jgi:HSP20 family protein
MTIRALDLGPFDLLWRDLFELDSHFSSIAQKISHPTDIYESEDGLVLEIAAVGLEKDDIEILVNGDQLHIRYKKPLVEEKSYHYKGIKKSSFDLGWKIAPKFDLGKLEASLDKGLLKLVLPLAEPKEPNVKKIDIKTPKQLLKG